MEPSWDDNADQSALVEFRAANRVTDSVAAYNPGRNPHPPIFSLKLQNRYTKRPSQTREWAWRFGGDFRARSIGQVKTRC